MNAVSPLSGPHTHAEATVSRIMLTVVVALLPATLFGIYQFGWPALNLFLITTVACLAFEGVCLRLAGKPVRAGLYDGSALLTGWLLAMTLPPWAPWWIGVVGGFFAVVIGKQVFGGLGQNLFNPAMVARVVLLISFPMEMTTWIEPKPFFSEHAPDFAAGAAITFNGIADIDSVSSASILGHVKTAFTQDHTLSEALAGHYDLARTVWGTTSGSLGETSALLLALGGLLLLGKGVISWRIPLALLGTLGALAMLFHGIDSERYAGPAFHLLTGGAILAAFFIATDPVTSPSSPTGQLVFGAGCGFLMYAIRTWGGFPEGIGFAVLIMNAMTPLIDFYLRPRIYGRTRNGSPKPLPGNLDATKR